MKEDKDNDTTGVYGELLFKTYRAACRPLGNAMSYVNAAFLARILFNKPGIIALGFTVRHL